MVYLVCALTTWSTCVWYQRSLATKSVWSKSVCFHLQCPTWMQQNTVLCNVMRGDALNSLIYWLVPIWLFVTLVTLPFGAWNLTQQQNSEFIRFGVERQHWTLQGRLMIGFSLTKLSVKSWISNWETYQVARTEPQACTANQIASWAWLAWLQCNWLWS